MLKIYTFLLFLLVSGDLFGQDPSKNELKPCGTAPVLDPWLVEFRKNPSAVSDRSNDTLNVGIQLHLLARDNGTGRFSADLLLDAFCQLNADFEQADIRFFFKNEWNLIDSSIWHKHPEITDGIEMMFANNVPGALNAYFVSDPAGNCGYNLPYAGVAIAHGCAGEGDHTWAHEIGHALSLPHPFIGWEGTNYTYNTPTPLSLTYDYTHFHATPDTIIPAPLDTALVEFVDGSNCLVAGDRFCDTKPDYLSDRWACDAQGFSLEKQKDPNGVDFYSDGSLFMSYSGDGCQDKFSAQQIQAIRTNLNQVKSSWLGSGPVVGIQGVPESLSPVAGQDAPQTGAVLRWSSVPGATHYVVIVSRFQLFTLREFEAVVTDTTVVVNSNLLPNRNYYWHVRPFNSWTGCTGFSDTESFFTTPVSASHEPDQTGWRCYPTVLSGDGPITVEWPVDWLGSPAEIKMFDMMGRLCWQTSTQIQDFTSKFNIPTEQWAAGIYRMVVASGKAIKRQSFVITR